MSAPRPVSLRDHAADNLRYIRRTMEEAGSFTAVPGWGGVAMGATALAAGVVAGTQDTADAWLATWLVEAAIAILIGAVTMALKARDAATPLVTGPGRRFALNLAPALVVGALLTLALHRAGHPTLLPGVWLLMYGIGVTAGGAFSVPVVPLMGLAFLVLGAVALFTPVAWADALLMTGFGGFQIAGGLVIARRYGG